MKTRFNFNTIGLFTTDNKSMVAFYRDVMGFTTDWNGEDPDVRMQLGCNTDFTEHDKAYSKKSLSIRLSDYE